MNKLGIGISVGIVAAAGGFMAGVSAAPKAKEFVATAAADLKWSPLDPKAGDKGPQFSVVFGDMTKKAPVGFLLKVPAGGRAGAHTHTSDDYAVVVAGSMHNFAAGGQTTDEGKGLTVGSTWFTPGKAVHDNHCDTGADCEIFIYMPNGFDFKPFTPPAPKPDKPAATDTKPKAMPPK